MNGKNRTFFSLFILLLIWSAASMPAWAQEPQDTTTYIVQPGDTLTRIANRYNTTVDTLVALNEIENPDLIDIGQELLIPLTTDDAPAAPAAPPQTESGGPLTFTWSILKWQPADPDYVATVQVVTHGGQPPYTFYHDGLVQAGDTFQITWLRCLPKPGSIGVTDAAGAWVKEEYWLIAPYCPVGLDIQEPVEGAQLKHFPRNFNVTWTPTVDPAPPQFGMEIEVWQEGEWRAWKTYENFDDDLFFVPDPFPGDLGGRLRMWAIYEWGYTGPKTPWRYFEFRVTY